ncbi:MAG TPA: hypothetical protein PKY88_13140 [Anaerohalosphaeraceae bacterium]|nr:hypothetical protein [Anaerohalosphaeraceae bacterium]
MLETSIGKVKIGDPLRISTAAYNAFVDAAMAHRSQQHGMAGRQEPFFLDGRNLVRVKNTSDAAVGQFGILGVDGVIFEPSGNLTMFKQEVALLGGTPAVSAHSSGRFVVCAEPIDSGRIGLAWGAGVCLAQINVGDESHRFADIAEGDSACLASSSSGPCTILWKESGTGQKWAVIRFGGSGGGGDKPECFLLTDLSQNPMQGTHKILGEGWVWVDGSYGSVQILCHPASQLDNYRLSYVWAQKVSGIWVAAEMTNIPFYICSS